MKKIFVLGIISVLFLVACSKETESDPQVTPNPEEEVEMIPFEIIGNIINDNEDENGGSEISNAPGTKTSYDENLQFSWTQGDAIRIVLYKNDGNTLDQSTLNAASGGFSTTFSGTVPSGFTETTYAYYPSAYPGKFAGDYSQVALKTFDPFVDLSRTPLIGKKVADKVYNFNTACGLLKVNLTNVPAEATQVQLVSELVKTPVYNFSGTYTILNRDENGVTKYYLGTSSVIEGSTSVKYSFGSHSEGSSVSVYFPVAVGTIARGLSIRLLDSSKNEVSRIPATTGTITVDRNYIYNLPATAVPRYESIGTGKIDDNFLSELSVISNIDPTDVVIERCTSDATRYRLVNPYGAIKTAAGYSGTEDTDPYLYFRIKNDGLIYFEPYNTGCVKTKALVIKHGKYGNWDGYYANNGYSKVLTYNLDGTPSTMQLAPNYWYNNGQNGWTKSDKNNMVLIIMPNGVSVSPSGNASDNHFNFTLGPDVSSVHAWFSTSTSGDEPESGVQVVTETVTGQEVPAPANSGPYYLVYNVYNSSDEVVNTQHITFNYIKPETATVVTSLTPSWDTSTQYTYTLGGSVYCKDQGFWAKDTYAMLAVSDNPEKGNVMIVDFLGMSYDISQQHLWDSLSGWVSGSPIYGTLDYSLGKITFEFNDATPFYTDGSNNKHYIGVSNNNLGYTEEFFNGLILNINGTVDDVTYPLVNSYSWVGDVRKGDVCKMCYVGKFRLGTAGSTITE